MTGKAPDGLIYAFPDPTGGMREFELNFSNATGVLRAVYAYPFRASLKEAESLWGRNYKETKMPNGNHMFAYKDRRAVVITDKDDNVIDLGVFILP